MFFSLFFNNLQTYSRHYSSVCVCVCVCVCINACVCVCVYASMCVEMCVLCSFILQGWVDHYFTLHCRLWMLFLWFFVGVLQMQKFSSHLLWTQRYQTFSLFRPGIGQNITLYASPSSGNSAFWSFLPSPHHSFSPQFSSYHRVACELISNSDFVYFPLNFLLL